MIEDFLVKCTGLLVSDYVKIHPYRSVNAGS